MSETTQETRERFAIQRAERRRWEARVAEIETALRFYADPSLWEATDERGIVRGGGWRAKEDSGAIAQAALKGKDAK